MKLIKKFLRSIKSKGGYTLIEVAAVVAITATLGAVVVPIALDKVSEGKLAAARSDTKSIGGAITGFYKDVGYMPGSGCNTAAVGSATVLVSGATNNYSAPLLASTVNTGWVVLTSGADSLTPTVGQCDFLDNHVVVDAPIATTDNGYLSKGLNWKGPYAESFNKKDPWGNSYLVYMKGMYSATSGSTKDYGWIISAGPNGSLETSTRSATLVGDDIGYVLFAADTGH